MRKGPGEIWPGSRPGYIMPSMNDPRNDLDDPKRKRVGVFYGLGAFLAWGVLPVYFKAMASVPSLEVLAHRLAVGALELGGDLLGGPGARASREQIADRLKRPLPPLLRAKLEVFLVIDLEGQDLLQTSRNVQ